jgi:spermidine synthase
MKKSVLIDEALTPDGNRMTLHERDGVYVIRINGIELMSTWHHNSEEKISEFACAHLKKNKAARVLIGGLGFGFSLRAALAQLQPDALVYVAEIMECVIKWNSDEKLKLASDALADARTRLIHDDVAVVIAKNPGAYDAIILDIDNGTSAMSAEENKYLYQETGLYAARAALRPGGCLAVWSASADPPFAKLLKKCGFDVKVEKVSVHANGGGWHTLFIGRISDKSQRS